MKQTILFILSVLLGFITLVLIACDYVGASLISVLVSIWVFNKFCEV